MKNLKELLQTAGLAVTNKQPYSLGVGLKRMTKEHGTIWGNLLNGGWIMLPKLTDQFLLDCTKRSPEDCIEEYAHKTGKEKKMFANLLEFALGKGFLDPQQGTPEGIEFINAKPIQNKAEVQEIFQFKKAVICFKSSATNRAQNHLSIIEWKKILEKLKNRNITDLSISIYHGCLTNQIRELVVLLKELYNNFSLHFFGLTSWKDNPLFQTIPALLNPQHHKVVFHLDADDAKSAIELKQALTELTLGFRKKEIKLAISVSYSARLQFVENLYIALQELGLPMSYELCFDNILNVNTTNPGNVFSLWKTLIEDYISKEQHSAGQHSAEQHSAPVFWGEAWFSKLKLSCGAGKHVMAIMDDGLVYPCPSLDIADYQLGSILMDPLGVLETKAKKVLSNMQVDHKKACKGCPSSYFCAGGCPARAYFASGDTLHKDPLCEFLKKGPAQTPWNFDFSLSNRDNYTKISRAGIWE